MTKVLAQRRCCLPACSSLHWIHGTENLLDDLHRARPAGGFSAADLVGPGGHVSNTFRFVVGSLPQRLVLSPIRKSMDSASS